MVDEEFDEAEVSTEELDEVGVCGSEVDQDISEVGDVGSEAAEFGGNTQSAESGGCEFADAGFRAEVVELAVDGLVADGVRDVGDSRLR
jgi:hypothetical protein